MSEGGWNSVRIEASFANSKALSVVNRTGYIVIVWLYLLFILENK